MKLFSILSLALPVLLLGACGEQAAPTGAAAVAAPVAEQTVHEWKMITSWPKNLPAVGTSPEEFSERVARMTNGRLQIRVYGANELVGGLEVFDAVSQGVAEMGHSGAYYWQGKIAATPFFSSIPFGLTGSEQDAWLSYGGGNELWRELYEPFGLIPVRGGNSGTQMFGWFNREINSLEDMQGLKMRIPSLGGEVFRRAGGTPVTMQVSDVFNALQTGVLDATEFISPYNDLAAGYHTVADYYYYPGLARTRFDARNRHQQGRLRRPAAGPAGNPAHRHRSDEPVAARRTHRQEQRGAAHPRRGTRRATSQAA